MRRREKLYQAALGTARAVAREGWGHAGLARALRGRSDSLAGFEEWARTHREPARPLALVHAPSVGEGLMAQAIIAAARAELPRLQVAFSFFSPSAERLAGRVGADVAGYLPWDLAGDVAPLLAALRPSVVAFVRTEIWPVLGLGAAEQGARVLLLNAVLGEGSSRLGAGARFLLGPAYRRLDAIGAVAGTDAERFARLGVDAARVHVTGDARFDQVAERVARLDRESELLRRLRRPGPMLVAGSTWPADEELLVPALAALPPALRPALLLAPHQPTAVHVEGALARCRRHGLAARALADVERAGTGEETVIVVDRVGILADLYVLADVAYVGGGFGARGLHSVVEPAALGVPVLYGPRHGNAREAMELAHEGGGFAVGADALAAALEKLVADPAARRAAGAAAARFVESRRGGAAANAALLTAGLAGVVR